MSENLTTRLWLMRAAFVALALLVIFWQLLPMETVPRRFTGPDMLLVMCVLWVLRRPDYAPPVAIAGVMLLADFVGVGGEDDDVLLLRLDVSELLLSDIDRKGLRMGHVSKVF